jgi:hypothetical protein
MCYNGLLSRATDLLPARPLYASPPGCTSNFPALHLQLLPLLHFLHPTAEERSASPSPSITSRLFAKTAGVASQALFSRRSPPVTRHFGKPLALFHSFAPERSSSPYFSIPCALFVCLPGMPPGAFPDFSRTAACSRPISGHFLHFSPPERSPSSSLSITSALFCRNTWMPARRISGGALLSTVNYLLWTSGPP